MNWFTFLSIIILVVSIIIHEISHGWAAYSQGDKTAYLKGRLSLNPFVHIDWLGSIIIPLFLILTNSGFIVGWAKPVPYNPNNLKNKRWGEFLVAIAGPLSNFILSIIFLFVSAFLYSHQPDNSIPFQLTNLAAFMNLLLALFNLLPIPPLDGSKIFLAIFPYQIKTKLQNFITKHHLPLLFLSLFLSFYIINYLIITTYFLLDFFVKYINILF